MERTSASPEQPNDLSFANVNGVIKMRQEQDALIQASIAEVLAPSMADKENPLLAIECALKIPQAKAEATAKFDEHCKQYLDSNLAREDDPDRYDTLLAMLRATSVDKMGTVKWLKGDEDINGNFTLPETSGKALVEKILAELQGGADPSALAEERKRIYKEALSDLSDRRATLAKQSIERRKRIRKGGKESKRIEEEFKTAQDEYQALIVQVGSHKMRYWHEEQGLEGVALKEKAVNTLLDEHQAFTAEEQKILENDNSLKGRVAKFLAKRHILSFGNGGVGMAVGFGAKWALRGAALTAIGLTGGAAAVAGFGAMGAIRTTKNVLTANISNHSRLIANFNNGKNKDEKDLKQLTAGDMDVTDHAAFVAAANELLQGTIIGRTDKDRKLNKIRLATVSGLGSLGVLAGFGIEHAAEHFGWLGGHGVSRHSSGKAPFNSGNHTGDSPSGTPVHPHGNSGHTGGDPGSGDHQRQGVIDGYQTHLNVTHGEGYQQVYDHVLASHGQHLSNAHSWELTEHLDNTFHGDIFEKAGDIQDNPSYHMPSPSNYGIDHIGPSVLRPEVVAEMRHWTLSHDYHDNVTNITKKSVKKAGKAALRQRVAA